MADRYPIVVINGELKELPSGDTIPAAVVPNTFLGLTDTPSAYTSQALKAVRVNAGESALEFYTPSSGITIGSTAISSGTNDRILYQSGGVVSQDANLTWDTNKLDLGTKRLATDLVTVGGTAWSSTLGWTVRITTDNASRTPLQLVGVSGQSNPLLAIYDSVGTLNGRWNANGDISVNALTVAGDIGTTSGNSILLGDTSAAGSGIYAFFKTGHVSRTAVVMRAITSQNNPILELQDSSASAMVRFMPDGKVGIGATPSTQLHILATSNLFRAGYDASNYVNLDVSSSGVVTLNAVGSGAKFVFSDAVEINGSLTLSAQNIVTDTTTGMKIGTGTTQKLGFFNATPVTQRANIGQLTDLTGGTPGTSVDDVGSSFDQSTLNDNFATLVQKMNAVEQVLQDLGLTS